MRDLRVGFGREVMLIGVLQVLSEGSGEADEGSEKN